MPGGSRGPCLQDCTSIYARDRTKMGKSLRGRADRRPPGPLAPAAEQGRVLMRPPILQHKAQQPDRPGKRIPPPGHRELMNQDAGDQECHGCPPAISPVISKTPACSGRTGRKTRQSLGLSGSRARDGRSSRRLDLIITAWRGAVRPRTLILLYDAVHCVQEKEPRGLSRFADFFGAKSAMVGTGE